MELFKERFERIEQKYLMTEAQYRSVLNDISGMISPDEFGESRICNIYYDTPDWRIVRKSLEKPVYKEKLRLRCYGEPDAGSTAFVEIKKKFKGVVYKRRASMKFSEAAAYLSGKASPPKPCQITREIDSFINHYPGLHPAMLISYYRTAFYGKDDSEFRVTFDSNIMWRSRDVDLTRGAEGRLQLEPGTYLMEIKIPGAMPLWMSRVLDKYRVFPSSFSKYGRAYCDMISKAAAKASDSAGNMCLKSKNNENNETNKEGELSA